MTYLNTTEVVDAAARSLQSYGIDVRESDRAAGGADLVAVVPTSEGPRTMLLQVGQPSGATPVTTAPGGVIVVRRHVTPAQAARYRSAEQPYVDSGGNAWLDLPGFHLHIQGRKPNVAARTIDRPSRAFTPAGLRAVFVLLLSPHAGNLTIRRLATCAGISVGAAQAAVDDLLGQGYAHRARSSAPLTLAHSRLTQAWLAAYPQRLSPRLDQVRLTGPPPNWWLEQPLGQLGVALGGEIALADRQLPLRPTTTMLYGEKPWPSARKAGRLTISDTPNVILRGKFWTIDELDEQRTVPSLLIYADAISSGDPRQREVAEQLRESDADLRRLDDRA